MIEAIPGYLFKLVAFVPGIKGRLSVALVDWK